MQVPSLGQEDSPGGGHGNPLQYSCLENSMTSFLLVKNHEGSEISLYWQASKLACRSFRNTGRIHKIHSESETKNSVICSTYQCQEQYICNSSPEPQISQNDIDGPSGLYYRKGTLISGNSHVL